MKFIKNRITQLFKIQYPIIQGGMIWCSGWELASAVSNAGGLGLIGGGSMKADIFREQIRKCKNATTKPFGVNIPLLYPYAEEQIKIVIEENVPVVFTSAGNPNKFTSFLKENGIIVAHVIANMKFAKKSEEAGVDAIVAEGFEAGGHNGREETTSLVLIPSIANSISVPLIAAGGIASGAAMLAAMALGADGVQMGSRFVASEESSAHKAFKDKILEAKEGDTQLHLKKIVTVRLLANDFANKVAQMEQNGSSAEELSRALGKGRAKRGMFEGDLVEGELEIGQVASMIDSIKPVKLIIDEIIEEFQIKLNSLSERYREGI